MVTHYRETFYRKLINSHPQHEWLIIDGEKKIDDGRPVLNKIFDFPHKRFVETQKKIGPFTLRDYAGLFDFIKTEKPDLVIMPAISGTNSYRQIASLSRKNKLNLILWSCLWEHPDVRKNILKILKHIISTKYLKSPSYHVAYSSFAKRKIIKCGFPENKVFIAYNGIELDGLENLRIKEEEALNIKNSLNINLHTRLFLYVGGLGPDKNVKLLLEALVLLTLKTKKDAFKLLIIGDGPERQVLQEFVNKYGLNDVVIFLGRIVESVEKYFQISDCYVLPGAGGLGLNQSMYWEKPCIVSHADGTEEDLINDGITGFKFKENDKNSLSNTMNKFLNSTPFEITNIVRKAKLKILTQSNVDKMVETFGSVIHLFENK